MIREISPTELPQWEHFSGLSDLEKARLGPISPWLETGKIRIFSLERDGRLLARLAAMVNPRLQDQTAPTGLLGFFSFADEAWESHADGLTALMHQAMHWLRQQGMKRVRGPMNFTTWYSYRAETETGDYPRFPGEDVLDTRYARFIEKFMPAIGVYNSQLIEDHRKAQEVGKQLGLDRAEAVSGVRIVEMPREQVLGDMKAFFDVASAIFPQDYSYGPISFAEFQQLYGPILQRVPDFYGVAALDKEGRPVGLAYGYRHPFTPVKTSILKTIGVLPEYRRGISRGISWILTYRYHMNLIAQGYEQFVHAMMKEDNTSRAMSSRFARKIREYRLYEADL